jgi:hypothetical protein
MIGMKRKITVSNVKEELADLNLYYRLHDQALAAQPSFQHAFLLGHDLADGLF